MPDTATSKRQRTTSTQPTTTTATTTSAAASAASATAGAAGAQLLAQSPVSSRTSLVPPQQSSPNPRKRRASHSPKLDTLPPGTPAGAGAAAATTPGPSTSVAIPALLSEDSSKKKGRTNTPWTAVEEQRLKQMRDKGLSWSEIAKAFPSRTEGSVKKHWYKDMHYAEFAEDEALREAIREYEANKWKAIGQKLGKPAKACEQYAKEHFKDMI